MKPNTNIQVLRDGQPDYQYMPVPPTVIEQALSHVQAATAALVGEVALQSKMISYDLLHRTSFRSVRNEIVRRDKETQYLASIGLERTTK